MRSFQVLNLVALVPLMGVVLFVGVVFAEDETVEGWVPPDDPKPQQILQEARDDFGAGRYPEALAKHVWFHRHVLEYVPSLRGVRLSFALSYWAELAKEFPPALEALKAERDQVAERVVSGQKSFSAFQELAALNNSLVSPDETVKVFQRLHFKNPEFASEVFSVAKPYLIANKQFPLLVHYLPPDEESLRIENTYRTGMARAEKREETQSKALLKQFYRKAMTSDAALLVAVLKLSNQTEQAELIAERFLSLSDAPEHQTAITSALDGEFPEPFPAVNSE
ncbi:hypothetical protein KOR42_38070 [Thalassoglobus neptunius]|uniref:Uncharacterized protein n=1 Tax=Thalassoglobus neptunius TaxID=1938619 RepID=A0A5C5WID4_9PLAN|nr:hypothetical protein [Thalassoglobus neptunius]TWT49855.1 hypothetical protein KOR42_38070 [Thalassoglobus neptunius]